MTSLFNPDAENVQGNVSHDAQTKGVVEGGALEWLEDIG
jgi:hypothetical protein